MARHRKATMSSRLDRRRAGPSRVLIGGLARHFAAPPLAPKRASRRTALSQGVHRGRTNRSQATERHIPGHPRWPFSCTSVWPHRRIARRDIDLRARRCNGDPPDLFLHPGRCDPTKERQRAATSSGMPWCGSNLERGARCRAFRSIRVNARRDRPGSR
jgi:hypothetical protein